MAPPGGAGLRKRSAPVLRHHKAKGLASSLSPRRELDAYHL